MNEELTKILETMDVPHNRKQDVNWLWRNLGVRNGFKPGFQRAKELLKKECAKQFSNPDNAIL